MAVVCLITELLPVCGKAFETIPSHMVIDIIDGMPSAQKAYNILRILLYFTLLYIASSHPTHWQQPLTNTALPIQAD